MFNLHLPPGNGQALIFSVILLIAIICIYRARMNYQRPSGICLLLFRIGNLSFGFLFLLMGILALLSDEDAVELIMHAAVVGVFFAGCSIISWHLKSCGTDVK